MSAVSVSDDEIRARIRTDRARLGQTWCPHTATAAEAYARLGPRGARASDKSSLSLQSLRVQTKPLLGSCQAT